MKQNYKRSIVLILLIGLLISIFTGCANNQVNYSVTVEGSIFSGHSDGKVNTDISFDFDWLTKGKNTKYNKDLAEFAAILSDDVYFRTKDLDKGTSNRVLFEGEDVSNYKVGSFLESIGFSDVEYIESFKVTNPTTDTNDSVTLLMAHSLYKDKYDVYLFSIRGCFSLGEWKSVFDVGVNTDNYFSNTGVHPEWTDYDNYKGYDVAKSRVLSFIDDYINRVGNPNKKDCILVTGHSRGGAISNLVGYELEKRKDIDSYTYTFNCPYVTTKDEKCETIFNIFDSNDGFLNLCQFNDTTLYRFGTDLSKSIIDNKEIKDQIITLTGYDDIKTLTKDDLLIYQNLFSKCFKNRAFAYEYSVVNKVFDTKEDAIDKLNLYKSLISSSTGLGLEEYFTISDISKSNEGKYMFSVEYLNIALLFTEAETLAYGSAIGELAYQLFEDNKEFCDIIEFLLNHLNELSCGHRLANTFVLTQFF